MWHLSNKPHTFQKKTSIENFRTTETHFPEYQARLR
jgi:hypothetical protein